ncbi:MAG: flagellar export protein FliJ [Lachnospiraceae bacterium]|jgi:flagellar export protein FliJ|nr:flagellar export protein FliJ [Lachnospiraceae bacterium]RKI28854.1 flagellar export protein FliJ [bacterium D16-36]RKI70244.1 flagellar export protein FliJ [bacterium 1xD8-6]
MAKFIFKMESLLSIKYKLEDQAKAEYGMELVRLREEEMKLEVLKAKKEEYQYRLTDAVQDELVLLEIKKLENCVEHAKYNINVQKFVISQQQQRVDRAREKLDNAMKERKTYEKLKEKAFEQFKIEIEAQERKEIDELVSFRFGAAKESEV